MWKEKIDCHLIESTMTCLCGEEMVITDFEAWGIGNTSIHLFGVYSCPSMGCSGNLREQHEKRLVAMNKLTDQEKKMLGLWNWNPIVANPNQSN